MTIKNHSKICAIVSLAIFVVALVMSICGAGVNLGIDFAGGLSMQYDMGETMDKAKVDNVLNQMGLEAVVTVQGETQNQANIQIKSISNYTYDLGDAQVEADANDDAVRIQMVQTGFETAIREVYPNAQQIGDVNYVGPVAGATLLTNAFLSVLIASALMLVYIAIRFDFNSGLAAVLGLIHDVLMMLSFMVLLRSVIQMNSSFIAAMLTIVGYSINNTIVIFDRIRENVKKLPTTSRVEVVNTSIRECLGRTLTTTLTTLVTIVMLYVLGVDSIKEFALPIIIGILSGVYSANMLNGYVWAFLEDKKLARKAAKK